jgi:hypothetical protein
MLKNHVDKIEIDNTVLYQAFVYSLAVGPNKLHSSFAYDENGCEKNQSKTSAFLNVFCKIQLKFS